MALLLICGFIAVPVIEIAFLIKIGGWIGTAPTIAAVILTAGVGTGLFRLQGARVLYDLRTAVEARKTPLAAVLDGTGLLLAGVLLFLPGFATDTLGFLLFIPPLRTLMVALLVRHLVRRLAKRKLNAGEFMKGTPTPIIEGDFVKVEEPPSLNNNKP